MIQATQIANEQSALTNGEWFRFHVEEQKGLDGVRNLGHPTSNLSSLKKERTEDLQP